MKEMEEIDVPWAATRSGEDRDPPACRPPITQGGTRMGNDPNKAVVNKLGQSWDIHNLFIVGSSTFRSMRRFNRPWTIEASPTECRCDRE